MKWNNKKASVEVVRSLQEKFNLPLILAQILAVRGVRDPEDVKYYLEKDISFLENPFLFRDMDSFADRVLDAVEEKERVHVFGDRDVDGITSTALLVTELRRMGLTVSWSVPMGDEPYAFSREAIDKVHEEGTTLCLTVDCGISCAAEIAYAATLGIDFLVTDHHIAPPVLPEACAIINPRIPDSGYPYNGLAGVGVVAKCIWALRFAQTKYYKERFILLHSMPTEGGTIAIEAVKLENLVQTDRIAEEVVPALLSADKSRILKFLDCGLPVFVLDKAGEVEQLKKAFPRVDIYVQDLRADFEKVLPATRGRSLFELSGASRFGLYSPLRSELDTLIGLYAAYIRITTPSIYREYIKIMDLVAIGTISDLMPMTGENRILVRTGLKQLEKNERTSLQGFLAMQNLLGRQISGTDVSWQISPLINAAGRMGQPDVAIKMLLAENRIEADSLASRLQELNKERQKAGETCWSRLYPAARKSWEDTGGKLVLVMDSNIPRGITGIFATRLEKAFRSPAMVITQTQDSRAVGSMRSPKNFNCHNFLQGYSDLLDDYGGHNFAGGFTTDSVRIQTFVKRVMNDVDYMDIEPLEEDAIDIDAVIPEGLFTEGIIKIVDMMEPYGEANPTLVFEIKGATIENLTAMTNQKDAGSNHLRMNISYGSYKWPAVFWAAGERAGRDFCDGDRVNVAFRLGHNYFRGQDTLQLTIQDIKRV